MRKFFLRPCPNNDELLRYFHRVSYTTIFTLSASEQGEGYLELVSNKGESIHVPLEFVNERMIEIPPYWGRKIANTLEELL